MVQAIRKRVRVGAGGVVEVRDPQLQEGSEAEVIVLLDEVLRPEAPETIAKAPSSQDEPAPLPLTEIIGSGKGLFATPEEVDQYIRDLRDEWD